MQVVYGVLPVLRYYPVVNTWAYASPREADPGMGWYSHTINALLVSLLVLIVAYAIAHILFSRGTAKLSTKADIALSVIAIIFLLLGAVWLGYYEYLDLGVRKLS